MNTLTPPFQPLYVEVLASPNFEVKYLNSLFGTNSLTVEFKTFSPSTFVHLRAILHLSVEGSNQRQLEAFVAGRLNMDSEQR